MDVNQVIGCDGRSTIKVLVFYDSVYGNTEKIARGVGGAIIREVKVFRAGLRTIYWNGWNRHYGLIVSISI
jgi:hypothetical protein